jgi:hypothetical protein
MTRSLFLVAQSGGQPTYIFQSLAQAEEVLGAEFWEHFAEERFDSSDGRWVGWLAAGDEVARLLGWVPEAVLDAA